MALIEKLKNIANAIRSKTNKSEELTLEQMASEVEGIDVMQGVHLTQIGYAIDEEYEFNNRIAEGIKYAEEIKQNWDESKTNLNKLFYKDRNLVFFPNVDTKNVVDFSYCFWECGNLLQLPNEIDTSKVTTMEGTFYSAGAIKKLPNMDTSKVTSIAMIAYNCCALEDVQEEFNSISVVYATMSFYNCYHLKRVVFSTLEKCTTLNYAFYRCRSITVIKLGSVKNVTNFSSTFVDCGELYQLDMTQWKQTNISLSQVSKLSPESIHYLIQNAMNVVDGAEEGRTLSLQETAKKNWQNSEYYEQDLAVLEQKGITIA